MINFIKKTPHRHLQFMSKRVTKQDPLNFGYILKASNKKIKIRQYSGGQDNVFFFLLFQVLFLIYIILNQNFHIKNYFDNKC